MPISISSNTIDTFATFGDLLRFLRRRVSLTQMELANLVGYSHTQISRLEQNLRLPDLQTIETNFVLALGLEDEPKVVARLLELAANVRREDAPAPGLAPYKGLNFYDEADADLFTGRETLTAQLVERILSMDSNNEAASERFLAVVGASGSGKSSLARAGLVPALRWNKTSADWQIFVLTPTERPLENLATILTSILTEDSGVPAGTLAREMAFSPRKLHEFVSNHSILKHGARLLLVIDQFEEVFALCRSEEERAAFIANLLTALSAADGPVLVVITLRADFYTHCAGYVQLREVLSKQQLYIGAMTDEELRRAIVESAERGRWELEPGLVDLLLHDAGHEPGTLPLLSHALLETWTRRRGRTMTLSGYAASRGVRGAIAETAETVFTDQFTQEQQAIARKIFLRLTELSDGAGEADLASTADTRRRATFNELILKPEDADITHAVLNALADARLITTTEDAVEVAHEALIREWPTLRGWLEENRSGLRLHRQLTESAQEWLTQQRAPDMVFRGARLALAREWAFTHAEDMNVLEHEFLTASQAWADHDLAEREAQRQREFEAVQKLAESEYHAAKSLRRRAVYLVAVLGLALIAALVAVIFANRNATLAGQNAAIAETAQATSKQAIADFTRSEAQRLSAEATNLLLNHADTNLTALLTIQSLNMLYTPSGDAALAALTTLGTPPKELKGHTDFIWDIDVSPDGRYLATGSLDTTARLWDLNTGELIRVFSGHTAEITGLAFSPDSQFLVTASVDGTARLWNIASGETEKTFPAPMGNDLVAFSPDGRYITITGFDKDARIWDVATVKLVHTLSGHTKDVTRVTYSPDGKYVLTGSNDNTACLWDTATGNPLQTYPGHTDGVSAVAFSPDGKYIATGDLHTARLWDVATGQIVREISGYQNFVSGIQFSPDGKLLLIGSFDSTSQLYDAATGQIIRVFERSTSAIEDVAFSPDGRLAITAGDDKIAKIWNLQSFPGGMQFNEHKGPIFQASFSPDGTYIVTTTTSGTSQVWNTKTGEKLVTLTGHSEVVRGSVFSPDGTLVLTTSVDKTARLWDAASGKELRRFLGHTAIVNQGVFSPDAKHIITTSYDGTARVWDAQTAETILIYGNQGPGHVNRVAFSPNGKTVVTSGDDGTARIWDPLTGKDIMVFKGHTDIVAGVAFSPDGRYLVTSSFDSSVSLWEIASGKEIREFAGHPGGAFGATFSPDGRYILTSGLDMTARLWDVQTGQELRRFTGHTNEIRSVAFSPDGKYILTASNDETARLWLIDLQETIQAVCGGLTRDLTAEERIQFDIPDQGPTCPL
jgi:WD40 repeat protein/transcriptional regulator with XRE-family HTH domain